MCIVILDGEWSITKTQYTNPYTRKTQELIDGTPYNKNNTLVGVSYQIIDREQGFLFFNHNSEKANHYCVNTEREKGYQEGSPHKLQDILNRATLIVGHNLQADIPWLLESGFKYDGELYDTMIFEYVRNKCQRESLKLSDLCIKYKLNLKADILDTYFSQGVNTNDIPYKDLAMYAIQDIKCTYDLYIRQQEDLAKYEELQSMSTIIKTMNEFLWVLVGMTRSGVKVDPSRFELVENDYKIELNELKAKLNLIAKEVMGDLEVNLNSPEQLSQLVYGIKVLDKNTWAETFNLGSELRNGVSKKKYPKRYKDSQFRQIIKMQTGKLYRTVMHQCPECKGLGKAPSLTKAGDRYVMDSKTKEPKLYSCKTCTGRGVIYKPTDIRAGLGVVPLESTHASVGGFGVGGDVLESLLDRGDLNPKAEEFLTTLERYSAVKSYLTAFIEGINKSIQSNDILHIQYNQCIAATGRLTSRFHNLPKGKTFPIKKCFVSRWQGGKILNADAGQLEFRVAALLAQDYNAMQLLVNEGDVHALTKKVLNENGENVDRDQSKPHTFKPLYGGRSGSPAQIAYYEAFLEEYSGIRDWQNMLADQACNDKQTQSPSGRIYAYPFATRKANGSVTFFTQICNYQVQGFGFDIMMLILLDLHRRIKHLKSVIILNTHDSITIDIHPSEVDQVISICRETFTKNNVCNLIESKYNITCNVEFPFDIELGDNYMETVKI